MEDQQSLDTEMLELALRYFAGIRDAARACVDNFSWLMLGGEDIEYVPCLDFDVVAASLFDLSVPSHAGSEGTGSTKSDRSKPFEIDLGTLAGPAVLEFFARRMKRIAIPSGAMAELLAFKQRTRLYATDGARDVLRIL